MADLTNEKKMYLVKLAEFLVNNGTTMSGSELVDHFNRNKILTSLGTEYCHSRGIYRLLAETYVWLESMGIDSITNKFLKAFVDGNGEYPWNK
jgi:hypothetical protein